MQSRYPGHIYCSVSAYILHECMQVEILCVSLPRPTSCRQCQLLPLSMFAQLRPPLLVALQKGVRNDSVLRVANVDDAATANTYRLDLTSNNPTWQAEAMSAPRIMPDAVLLPDGTVFICNGADTGIAGGTSGGGLARNARSSAALSGEIYKPQQQQGARMSGDLQPILDSTSTSSTTFLMPFTNTTVLLAPVISSTLITENRQA